MKLAVTYAGGDIFPHFGKTEEFKNRKEYVPEHVTEVRFSSDLTHLKDVRDEGYDKGKAALADEKGI